MKTKLTLDDNIIKNLASCDYRANHTRNMFIIVALILSSFLITTIFRVGGSYIKAYETNYIRLMGSAADVTISHLMPAQYEKLLSQPNIKTLGAEKVVGNINTKLETKISLVATNNVTWTEHITPAITDMNGYYPSNSREVMMPISVLNEIGITNPRLGMEIELTYTPLGKLENEVKLCILSGYYTDFLNSRIGFNDGKSIIYVSEQFNKNVSANDFTVSITFTEKESVSKNCEKLKENISFSKEQIFTISPMRTLNESYIFIAMGAIALFILISAYLLIYNIFNISLLKNINMYGLLKSIGMTNFQIIDMIMRQVLKLAIIGITIGIVVGDILSFVIVPTALKFMTATQFIAQDVYSFSPLVLAGTIGFTGITAFLSALRPAIIVSRISPIEAKNYTHIKTTQVQTRQQINLFQMSWRNIWRDKKSTYLVLISMTLGLSLYFVVNGLISMVDIRQVVANWEDGDIVISYDKAKKINPLTPEIIEEVTQLEGVNVAYTITIPQHGEAVNIVYDNEVFGKYMYKIQSEEMITNLQAYQKNMSSQIFGLNINHAHNITDNSLNLQRFEAGETVLLTEQFYNGDNLFNLGDTIKLSNNNEDYFSFRIGESFIYENFNNEVNTSKTAPNLYISETMLESLYLNTQPYKVILHTNQINDDILLEKIRNLLSHDPEIVVNARLDKMIELRSQLAVLEVLGFCASFILLLVGVMNFINTLATNVILRQKELIIMETLGMCRSQLYNMLTYEGGFYAGLTLVISVVASKLLLDVSFPIIKNIIPFAKYNYWTMNLMITIVVVGLICIFTPIIVYKWHINKNLTRS
ncbi:MAG: hypothetical protein ATN36_07730 [Epulopiscium sp. Nele67-Bin005]|nr:MAG: hypothetical protein ATN36_07730 [Epulopiscium sp. Nele67-Bin005]